MLLFQLLAVIGLALFVEFAVMTPLDIDSVVLTRLVRLVGRNVPLAADVTTTVFVDVLNDIVVTFSEVVCALECGDDGPWVSMAVSEDQLVISREETAFTVVPPLVLELIQIVSVVVAV